MTTVNGPDMEVGSDAAPSLVDALLVYAEPLAAEAHAVVLGDAEGPVASRLLELGARSVLIFDPDPARAADAARNAPRGVTVRALVDDLDVRDGAFDLALVPDLSELNDPRETIARLRRAVARNGAVVAMGRAKLGDAEGPVPFASDLGPASLEYAELYDLFAIAFEEVSLAGVVPFRGVVFAELGREEDEASAVSVDTRFAPGHPPSIFAVVARVSPSAARPLHAREPLDPYAIVQIAPDRPSPNIGREIDAEVAEARLRAELLTSQLDEVRERVLSVDALNAEARTHLERTVTERDGALTRAMELEAVLAASQQTMGTLERRLLEAEQGMLDRDDRIAALSAQHSRADTDELDLRSRSEEPTAAQVIDLTPLVDRAEQAEAALAIAVSELASRDAAVREQRGYEEATTATLAELRDRAERAEAAIALNVADLLVVTEAHALETENYEQQLRDRARVVAGLEKELVRREQLVKQLVASLEATREATTPGVVFESAAPLSVPTRTEVRADPAVVAENTRLRQKLDELAADVARREGELHARGWRIAELENQLAKAHGYGLSSEIIPAPMDSLGVRAELDRVRDELDALRQALAQEHAARVAAESGEELSRARSELARQSALLEQMRGRLETS